MKVALRLTLALLALLLPQALLGLRGAPRPWQGPPIAHAIPGTVGTYALVERIRLAPEIVASVRPSDYLYWQYAAEGKLPLVAYVAVYPSIRDLGAGAHDPRLCYPAQGWEVLEATEVTLPIDAREPLRATRMLSQQGERRELVLFWVQPAGRWPASPALEQLLGLRDALLGRDRYVFVRVSTPGDSEAEAQQLSEFARSIAPRVRGYLD